MSVPASLQPLSDETFDNRPPPFLAQGLSPMFTGIRTGLSQFEIDYIPDQDGDNPVPYVSLVLTRNRQDLRDREQVLQDREQVLQDREKALRDRRQLLQDREQDLEQDQEQVLQDRGQLLRDRDQFLRDRQQVQQQVLQDRGQLLRDRNQDLLEQQRFIEKILMPGNPIGFTPTGSCEIVTRHESKIGSETQGLCLFYKRHVSTGPHDCDECDDFCIKLTTYLKLLIKYKTPRKTEFSKADFTHLHDFFVRIFNVMRLAFSGSRSITVLRDYFVRVPNWFQKFQGNFVNASFKCEALEEDEEDKKAEALDEDEYERKSSAEALTMVRKEVEKSGKSMSSLANKYFALKKFQTALCMKAIPRILLAIPEGFVNPYAQYIDQFIKSVNVYDMLYTCQAGIPQFGDEMTSASSSASSPASLDEEGGSFMTTFANEGDSNIFCIAQRSWDMTEVKVKVGDEEIPLSDIASDPSPQSMKNAMKAVLEISFKESIDMHVTQLNKLTGYEDMVTGESVTLTKETFKNLFDVYIDLKMSPTPSFTVVEDECLIKLAYFAECIGDRKMVFQIINYFLSYRFEYMVRLWKIEMPKVEEDLKMPDYFLTVEQWHEKCKADFGNNYGWDENGRDA